MLLACSLRAGLNPRGVPFREFCRELWAFTLKLTSPYSVPGCILRLVMTKADKKIKGQPVEARLLAREAAIDRAAMEVSAKMLHATVRTCRFFGGFR